MWLTGGARSAGRDGGRGALRQLARVAVAAAFAPFAYVGSRALFLLRAASSGGIRFHGTLLVRQLQFVGFESLPIVVLVGFFSGAVAAESALRR